MAYGSFHEYNIKLGINTTDSHHKPLQRLVSIMIDMSTTRLIVVLLLVTDFGVRRSLMGVNGFGNYPIYIPTRKSLVSLNSVGVDQYSEHLLLLDESVMLYSQLKKELESDDVQTKRESELTSLIEDVVLDGNGVARDGTTNLVEDEDDNGTSQEAATEEPATLEEITKALDEQILLGSQTTFSEDELKAWVERIDVLRDQLSKLSSPPPASPSSATTEPKSSVPPPPALDELRTRLESMRTSIESAPEGDR